MKYGRRQSVCAGGRVPVVCWQRNRTGWQRNRQDRQRGRQDLGVGREGARLHSGLHSLHAPTHATGQLCYAAVHLAASPGRALALSACTRSTGAAAWRRVRRVRRVRRRGGTAPCAAVR
jgi:hypothetical protein